MMAGPSGVVETSPWQTTLAQLVEYPDFHARFLNTLSLLEYIGARKIVKSQHEARITPTVLAHMVEELRHAQILKKTAIRVGGVALRSYADDALVCGAEGRAYIQSIDRAAAVALGGPDPWANYLLTTLIVEERAQALYPVYDALLEPLGLGGPLAAIVREEEGHLAQVTALLAAEARCTADMVESVRQQEHRSFQRFFDHVAGALAERAALVVSEANVAESQAIIRPDIYEKHQSLFGAKAVNGRTVGVEDLIARLTRETKDEFRTLLGERHAFQAQVGRHERTYDFLPADTQIADADGRVATVRDIRQGMLDGFFGRKTPIAWRLNPSVPIPADTMTPGLEGTGPAIDLGMAMGALNTGAASWMWDWEDAGGDFKDQLYQAWENLRDLLAHKWDGRPFVHPTKTEKGKPREYTIDLPPAAWPTIFHRVPGLHLTNRQISLDGEPVPGIIPALVIHALVNYDAQKKNGSGIYYYVPKIETWQEARLVAGLLKGVEEAIGVPRGTLKIKMLNERAEYALQQEAIMWVLRENLIGPNVGRWDYLNSREEMFRHDPAMVIPDPNTVTMTEPSLTYYTMRNALLALVAGGMPIGGMAAQMQNPGAPENDAKALRDIWFDKLRERLTGLFRINGTLYDTYRQSWVATIAPSYVDAGREPLVTDVQDLQRVVDQLRPDEAKRLEDLKLLKGGRIAPLELTEADLGVDRLFSPAARTALLARPAGPTTEDGLRYAMYMATEFMYQQLLGNNAAAIYDPRTGLRFMNDLATYEIFWHFLYLTVFHGVKLTADGTFSKAGDRVTPQLFLRLLDERREVVKQLFAKLGRPYESTNAELVLTLLQRQVVETNPDGAVVPQPRWIKYGSRVLLSIIEETADDRAAILDGIFGDRRDIVARREQATDPESRRRAEKVLRAYDFVYDTRDVPVATVH